MDIYLASVLTNMTLIAFLALSAYLVLVVGEVSFGQQAFFGIGAYITASATALAGVHIFWGPDRLGRFHGLVESKSRQVYGDKIKVLR